MPNKATNASPDIDFLNLLLLHWIAGMLDGLSYVRAHAFTANMTGNLVLLAIHTAQRNRTDAIRSLVALIAFALGAFGAALLVVEREDGRGGITLGFAAEFCLLATTGVVYASNSRSEFTVIALLVAAAAALAAQSVVVRRMRISGVVTTFITGTVTTTMVGLAKVLRKKPSAQEESEEKYVVLLVAMLLSYFLAAVFGTILTQYAPRIAGFPPALLLLCVIFRRWNAERFW